MLDPRSANHSPNSEGKRHTKNKDQTIDHTKKSCSWKLDHGEQDAVDDARLPAARVADDDRYVLILSHRLDADPPWAQEARH